MRLICIVRLDQRRCRLEPARPHVRLSAGRPVSQYALQTVAHEPSWIGLMRVVGRKFSHSLTYSGFSRSE
jgi:hypothetical protein